jgi:8-oxo-dGTP diphosphatase
VEIVLVRHGHAGTKEGWSDEDRLRPLDGRGRRQAVHLVEVIAPMTPTALVSSPFLRCLQTVAPIAARTGLTVEEDEAFLPDAGPKALEVLRRLSHWRREGPVVVCTHGEVMGEVLGALATEDALRLSRRTPGLKGCAWLLDFHHGRVETARYIPPAR